MKTIKINRIGSDLASLKHSYDEGLFGRIKKIPGIKWNSVEKRWELPYSENILDELKGMFPDTEIITGEYFYFFDLIRDLKLKNYSPRTIKIYLSYNIKFLKACGKKPSEVGNTDIRNYLYELITERYFRISTLNMTINSLKYYYGKILGKSFIYEFTRPRSEKKLPIVLNKKEILQIINSIKNLKHKTIVMLIYSSGMRVSEAVKIKKGDIDYERKTIHIKGSKGKKDRRTILSDASSNALKKYIEKYKPDEWLFEGMCKNEHITIRTVQKIFKDACEKCRINKKATVHTLRHSFATHLLDSGVDIKFIQELLGHKSTKTTEIYTHVSTNSIKSIKSPLDDIIK
jgi:integrase/recombinase XerD